MPQPQILIVEDDGDWQEIYRRCLHGTDYEITATRKLNTAMALLEEQPFDVVITDLKMLGGTEEFSGFGVLEQAKAISPDVQVIVVTGYGSADHALRAMGSFLLMRDDVAGARACFEQSLRIFSEMGDGRQENRMRFHLGLVALRQGDYDEARAYNEHQQLCSARSATAGVRLTHTSFPVMSAMTWGNTIGQGATMSST